jgi:PadR family transcriptional regulator, regulatory protein PadR
MAPSSDSALSTLDYHVLLAIAEGPMYGYAIRDAVERESDGTLTPRAGTLYRVIARLMSSRLVAEADAPDDAGPHPGRARRYYGLTSEGRRVLSDEAHRLEAAATLARERLSIGRP